jgi:hypothetical protein
MDARLLPRVGLGEIATTGRRKRVRDLLRLAVMAMAFLSIVGFVFEHHRECQRWHSSGPHDWAGWHTFLSDAGPWPIVVMMFILLGQSWSHRGRMILATMVAVVGAILGFAVLLSYAMVHLLSHVDHGAGVMPFALIAVVALSALQSVAELVLAVAERRALERDEPVVPGAVVVRTH